MDSIWDRFTVASLWLKTVVIITTTLIVVASFCGLIISHDRQIDFYRAARYVLFTNSEANKFGDYSTIFHIILQFLLAVWQSFFLLHVLTYSRTFRFSKFLVVYDKPFSARYADCEYLVFRLMNSGSSDLYNVVIK